MTEVDKSHRDPDPPNPPNAPDPPDVDVPKPEPERGKPPAEEDVRDEPGTVEPPD